MFLLRSRSAPWILGWAFLLALVILPGSPKAATDAGLTPLWNEALSQLDKNNAPQAARLLNEWIETAGSKGLRSADAHHNLGIIYWTMHQTGPAVYHLLTSAMLHGSLPQTLNLLMNLNNIERDIGIKDGLSRRFSFRFRVLMGNNTLTFLLALGFWACCAMFLVRWIHGAKYRALARHALQTLVLVCWGTAVIGILQRQLLPVDFAVMSNEQNAITLYRSAEEKPDEKLVELPSGTMVSLTGGKSNGLVQVARPISGWVRESDLQFIRPGT